jgi:chromosomal replication initiation ATPase DnaA
MTTTERNDILVILHHHRDLPGVDKARAAQLIEAMGGTYATDADLTPDLAVAVRAVESVTGITLAAMQVHDRERRFVEARQLLAHTLREHCGMLMREIGEVMGRDHATVIHYLRTVENNPKIFGERIRRINSTIRINRLNPPSASDKNQTR